MIIKRTINGQEIEIKLTADEISEAHKQFIVDWMESVVYENENEKEIPQKDVRSVALSAYDVYCDEEGLTEYEAVQKAIEDYKKEKKKKRKTKKQ